MHKNLPIGLSLTAIFALTPTSALAEYDKSNYLSVSIAGGARLGGELDEEDENGEDVEVASFSDENVASASLSWYYEKGQEGSLMYSVSKQEFEAVELGNRVEEITVHYLHFGGRLIFPGKVINTSVELGIGATHFAPENNFDSETKFSGHIGGGLRYDITEQLSLKADAKLYGTVFNSDGAVFCGQQGCLAQIQSDVMWQTEVTTGLEYRF